MLMRFDFISPDIPEATQAKLRIDHTK